MTLKKFQGNFQLDNSSSEESSPRPPHLLHGFQSVKITIYEALDLAAKDRNGASDPYAGFHLLSLVVALSAPSKLHKSARMVFRTKTIWKNLNPKWKDQSFEWLSVPQ